MICKEFGDKNAPTVMLLHGGGLSWWSCRDAAEMLKEKFHVVIPILDGHAGSDRHFTSIEDNAAELISAIDEKFGGKVKAIGGLSLGGQILLEMLSQRKDICETAFVESAAVIPSKMMASSRFQRYFMRCPEAKRAAVERRVGELVEAERDLCHPISYPHLCNLFCALAIYEYDTAHGVSPEEAAPTRQLDTPDPGRRSVPASVAWVPSCAGLMLGGYVVQALCKKEDSL